MLSESGGAVIFNIENASVMRPFSNAFSLGSVETAVVLLPANSALTESLAAIATENS